MLTDGLKYVCPPAMAAGCWATLSVVGGGGGSASVGAGAGGVGGALSVTLLLGAANPSLTSISSVTGGAGVTQFAGGGGAASAVYAGTNTLLAVAGGGGGGGQTAGSVVAAGGAGGITSPLFAGTVGGTSGTPTGGGPGLATAPGAGGTGSFLAGLTGTPASGIASFANPGVGGSCPVNAGGCTAVSGGGIAGNGLVYAANGGGGCSAGTKAAGGGGGGYYGGGSGGASNSNIGARGAERRLDSSYADRKLLPTTMRGRLVARSPPLPAPSHSLPLSWRRRRLELGDVVLHLHNVCVGDGAHEWPAGLYRNGGCRDGRVRCGLLFHARRVDVRRPVIFSRLV